MFTSATQPKYLMVEVAMVAIIRTVASLDVANDIPPHKSKSAGK